MTSWKRSLARIGGNFGVSFFTTFLAFDFVLRVPSEQIVFGAMLSSGVIAGLSLSYEVRKWGEAKNGQVRTNS